MSLNRWESWKWLLEKECDLNEFTAVPEFISGIKSVVSTLGSLAAGFAPLIPQLVSFGSGMTTTIQQVVGACVPACRHGE